jgi:hypothetical protein
MKRYTVDLIINTSHFIDDIDYHSSNAYKIIDNDEENEKIVSSIDVENVFPEKEIKKYFEQEAQVASLAVAKNEKNSIDGCPYFTVNWTSLNIKTIPNVATNHKKKLMFVEDSLSMREYFSMKSTRTIQLEEVKKYLDNINNYSFLVESFYHGLMSNNNKSKYFNFFVIIEHIENSSKFRNSFKEDLLFNEEEKYIICNFIKQFGEHKKSILANILTKTRLSRKEKLFRYLSGLHLPCIDSYQIKLEDIDNIIDQRNKLFHSSEKFNLNILYDKLFPLVKEIVIKNYMQEN